MRRHGLHLLGVVLLGLCGCSFPQPSQPHHAQLTPVYDNAACVVDKTQGREADLRMATWQTSAESRFFHKKYNRSYLDAIRFTSAVATGRFVSRLLDDRLYRVQREYVPGEKVCPTFTDLPLAPSDMLGVWRGQLVRIKDPNARLAGIYFQYCDPEKTCDDRRMILPTIMIDDGRDRWTLVHEMMHFNFDRERKRDLMALGDRALEDKAKLAKQQLYDAFELYLLNRDRASLTLVQAKATWLIQIFTYQSLIRSIFEEIAIEGTLIEDYLDGRLENVSPRAVRNAVWYMTYAHKNGTERFNETVYRMKHMTFSMTSLAAYIRTEARANSWNELEAGATADERFIENFLLETAELIDSTKLKYQSRTRGVTSSADGEPSLTLEQPAAIHIDGLPAAQAFERWKRY